jgi:UDP-N-acetylmuramoyl-tripeptide--D-alanyl-D-alanine ligase
MNALAAAACCYATGISLTTIAQGLQNFAPVAGRLQPKQAACGARVIDDTYNANPDSVKAAIEVLAGTASRKILVLGDMGEVGQDGAAFHQEIGAYAKEKNITLVFTLGALAEATTVAFGAGAMHFNDIADLFKHLQSVVQPSDTVLLKGSRFMKMERVVAFLVSPDGIVSGETSH